MYVLRGVFTFSIFRTFLLQRCINLLVRKVVDKSTVTGLVTKTRQHFSGDDINLICCKSDVHQAHVNFWKFKCTHCLYVCQANIETLYNLVCVLAINTMNNETMTSILNSRNNKSRGSNILFSQQSCNGIKVSTLTQKEQTNAFKNYILKQIVCC